MLVVVVGDTHGRYKKLQKEIKSIPGIELLLHTGDHYWDGQDLARKLKIKSHVVTGNCDRRTDGVKEMVLELEGHRILLTHGHLQNVKHTMNNLYFKAQQSRIDIVLFGHTHAPYLKKEDGIWFMNPGSPTFPQGAWGTYGLIELQPGKAELRIMKIT